MAGNKPGLADYLAAEAPHEERLDAFDIDGDGQELTGEERARLRQYMEDLAQVANTPAGFRVLVHILDRLNQFNVIFTGNSQTFYNAGLYEVGRAILTDIAMADLEAYKRVQV